MTSTASPLQPQTGNWTVREGLREALTHCLNADPNVFVLGEEVGEYQGAYKITQGLLEQFGPKRVIDTPITEYGFTGLAVGAAYRGLRPVVEFMSFNFSMQAIDHIINSAAKTRYMSGGLVSCPIVFRGPNGAAFRVGAQHSQCYASWYARCPGLKVVAPFDASSSYHLLRKSIQDPDPVVFLENEMLYGDTFSQKPWYHPENPYITWDLQATPAPEFLPHPHSQTVLGNPDIYEIGKAAILRPGKHVTLVAFSLMVKVCLEAAQELSQEGIEAEVIDLRSLRPLDEETILASVRKTHRIVSVEENWPYAGIGSEISALINEKAFDELDAPVLRVTGEDVPWPYAPNLEQNALPSKEKVCAMVRCLFTTPEQKSRT